MAQPLHDCFDDLAIAEHAGLDAADFEVARDGPHLGQHKPWRRGMHGLDAECVLRGKRSDGTCAVDAERSKGPQVCLDAGAAS